MRQILFYIIFLICINASANETREITVSFNVEDFELIEHDKGVFSITSPICTLAYDYGTSLPILGEKFDIKTNECLESYTIESEEILISNDVVQLLCPQILSTAETIKNNQHFIASSKMGGTNIAKYMGTYSFANERKIYFNLCPFRYEAKTHKLYLSVHIKLFVNLKTIDTSFNQETSSIFRQNVIDAGDYEYLIITSNLLSPLFEDLVKWKTKKGIKSQIVTVESIYESDNSSLTNPQKIKKFIMDYYNLNNHTLKYVLIGGDLNNVPSQQCNLWFYNNNVLNSTTTYSDTYYASLKGLDWSALSTINPVGDYDDDIDLSLDISVARLPFSNGNDVTNYVEKLIRYERNPKTSNWNNTLFMGGRLLSKLDTINGLVASDAFFSDSIMYHRYISPNWLGGRVRLYDTISDISGMNGFTANNLQSQLEEGFSFANISTHGSPLGWTTDDGAYLFSDASNLNNSGNTIVTTLACHTNDITSSYNLSRCLIKSENGGILSYWGSSKEGFYSSSGLGFSQKFIGEMYKNLFNSNNQSFYNPYHRLAYAVFASKGSLFTFTTLNQAPYRWLYLSMDLMGDPEMPVYTTSPQKISNITISQAPNSNYVHIDPGTYGTFTYCKYVKQNGYEDYYTKEFYRDVDLPNVNNAQCNICITSPNCIPYQAIYGVSVQLQGLTFEGDNHVHAVYDTTIGSNLSNLYSSGPVVVKEGSLCIPKVNGVTITDNFEVNLGAEFTIE